MRTHIYKTCSNLECPSKKDKSLGNIWGDPQHDILSDDGRLYSKCTLCETTAHFRDPDAYVHQRYPYYSASTDQVFQDKSHEKAYVKEKKLEAL